MEYSAAADWIKKGGICSQLHIHVLIWLFDYPLPQEVHFRRMKIYVYINM